MTTLKVANGDLVPTLGTGILETVSSIEEGSQNVARAILIEYNSYHDEGDELMNFSSSNSTSYLTESIIQQFLTEAINRLIIKQRDTEIDGKLYQVNQIKTRLVGLSTLVFLVEVIFADGQSVTIVDQAKIQPTQLNHLLNPASLIKI